MLHFLRHKCKKVSFKVLLGTKEKDCHPEEAGTADVRISLGAVQSPQSEM